MACRGWFTALLPDEATAIRAAANVDELLEKLDDFYTAAAADGRIQSVDKSWDAMHRVLCGGWLALPSVRKRAAASSPLRTPWPRPFEIPCSLFLSPFHSMRRCGQPPPELHVSVTAPSLDELLF